MDDSVKRILIIIGKLYIGGAERVAYDIGMCAETRKYEIHYVVFGDEVGEYECALTEKGCKIFHMPEPSAGYRAFMRRIGGLIDEYGYCAVHCHTMFNSGLVLSVAKRKGVPCRIAHSHSIQRPKRRRFARIIYEWLMEKAILACATHCIACGVKAGEWLYGKKGFAEKGILLLNGIETEKFRYDENMRGRIRKKLGLGDSFVVGHVGHFAAVKNQAFLIRLLKYLRDNGKNAKLLLLGDGEDRQMLESLVKELGIEADVIMTGNVMNVGDYLNAMDVFAFPSLFEGMPLSVVEAQTNGLRCVISDNVPSDVRLTNLVSVLSLDAPQSEWAKEIMRSGRFNSAEYCDIMKKSGFDVSESLKRVYEIYDGAVRSVARGEKR